MDSGTDTPEGFLHETKFVVLSFLGLVPPDFDPGFSEFDMHSSDTSQSQTPFSLPGSDGGSHCVSPRFLGVKSKFQYPSVSGKQSFSPRLSPRGSLNRRPVKEEGQDDGIQVTVAMVTGDARAQGMKDGDNLEMDGEGGGDEDQKTEEKEENEEVEDEEEESQTVQCSFVIDETADDTHGSAPPLLETSLAANVAPDINIVSPGATQSAFRSPTKSGDSPRLIIPPKSGQSSGSNSSEIASKDSDSSGLLGIDDWDRRKRHSIDELTEPLREELQEAFNQLGLEKDYFDVACPPESHSNSITSPTEVLQTCPLAREAIVAERIAHIGDMIMVQHKEEIELAMQQVFGKAAGSDPMSYGMFSSMIQHMVNTAVPEWYHLALMMNFTRRMAFGFLRRGNRSMGTLSDFAVRYIEENLAETIIEQGGWEAMANITPEELQEMSSASRSRSISPMPSDYISSPQPTSPPIIMESPTDPPGWQHTTATHLHVKVSPSDTVIESQSFESLTIRGGTGVKTSSPNSDPGTSSPGIDSLSPIAGQSGIDQTGIDQPDGSLPANYPNEGKSIDTNGGIESNFHIVLATAGAAAAVGVAATAAYAILKR